MKLIIGLGNPGAEYEKTRHNAGFLAVSEVSKVAKVAKEDWKLEKKFNAEIAEGKIGKDKVLLVKPQTFMNKSGEAAGKIARFYKIKPMDVLLIHDDLDLPLGTLRIKIGGGSAGHKGVQSIIKAVGENIVRFRIGTSPPKHADAMKLVLGKFSPTEMKKLTTILKRVAEAMPVAISEGLPKAMSLYNQ